MRTCIAQAQQQCWSLLQAAKDYRIDPYLHEACQADAESYCKGTKAEKGQVQACLVSELAASICSVASLQTSPLVLILSWYILCPGKTFCANIRPAFWLVDHHCLSRLLLTYGYPFVPARTACNQAIAFTIMPRIWNQLSRKVPLSTDIILHQTSHRLLTYLYWACVMWTTKQF